MDRSPVLTLREVASYLNAHPNTIYRLAKRGVIPAFKMGSDWRFNRESIDGWRLAQEQAFAQSFSSQLAKSRALADEVLHVVYWYQAEGFKQTVTASDVRLFVDQPTGAIMRKLNRLLRAGWVAKEKAGREKKFRLTPEGLAHARQLFGEERAATAGHVSLVEFALQRHEGDTPRLEEKSSGPGGRTEVRN